MKKFMCSLFTLVIIIPMCAVMSSAKTATYKSEFPDSNFRKCILNLVGNPKESAKIDTAKLAEIKTLNVASRSITSMDGIKYLTGLTSLDCSGNKLTKLDLSNNKALTKLCCQHNKRKTLFSYKETLATLNISKCTALQYLDCSANKLTNLDVSKNVALQHLDCSYNRIPSLDVSKNTALTKLNCKSNYSYFNLDLSNNTALQYLNCSYNYIYSLDVSKNTELQTLNIAYSRIGHIDVSNNTALKDLHVTTYTNVAGEHHNTRVHRSITIDIYLEGSIFTDHAGVFIGVGTLIIVAGIATFVIIRKKKKSSQGIEQ